MWDMAWAFLALGVLILLALVAVVQRLSDVLRSVKSLEAYTRWKDAGGKVRQFGENNPHWHED